MKTGHAPKPPACALARIIQQPADAEDVKKRGWREHGILVVSAEDPRLGWFEQKMLVEIGKKLYGKWEG